LEPSGVEERAGKCWLEKGIGDPGFVEPKAAGEPCGVKREGEEGEQEEENVMENSGVAGSRRQFISLSRGVMTDGAIVSYRAGV